VTRLSGQVVLVTGAGSGLGEAIARRCVLEGATVVAADIDERHLAHLADSVGPPILPRWLDVTDEARWIELLAAVRREQGRLDVLVNNAGLDASDEPQDPERQTLADWRRIEAVNVAGAFLGCKHAIPVMRDSGGGAIVNIASVAGLVATPTLTAYGATKAAVIQLTKTVAAYCARSGARIRCNCVLPGIVETPMVERLWTRLARERGWSLEEARARFKARIPLGEFQQPRDIAAAVVFLASQDARCITGTQLPVDGGFLIGDA